jgi:hypothetical protein
MKIEFRAFVEEAGLSDNQPKPSISQFPNWFKKMPPFTNNEKKFNFKQSGAINVTVKWCNPFMDSLSAGYMLILENDLWVEKRGEEHFFIWRAGGDDYVTTHHKDQVPAEIIPDGYNPQPYKFRNDWSIKTPSGYSALFMHPLNRTDLPFIVFSGFVETDGYQKPVHIPFVIRKDFEGIIPAGTPIAQVLPVKREPWAHKISPYNADLSRKINFKFYSKIYRAYKTLFWKKKDYR